MERLFGVETEYAFAALNHARERISPSKALRRLMSLAGRRLIHLPDEQAGVCWFVGQGRANSLRDFPASAVLFADVLVRSRAVRGF